MGNEFINSKTNKKNTIILWQRKKQPLQKKITQEQNQK
jgi:hypothetical protein